MSLRNRGTGRIRSPLQHFADDSDGAVAVEYMVLVGCVALAVLLGWQSYGTEVNAKALCQAQAVMSLSAQGCSEGAGATSPFGGVEVAGSAATTEESPEDDGCTEGWRGALCRAAHAGGDLVRDVVGDLPGGDFVADYATAAWSLPDALLQSTLPLLGLGGAGAPGVVDSWATTGKQLAALGCAGMPGVCSTLNSGLVPGFEQGEVTDLQIETGKSFVGWDYWANGEYGTAAGTLLPNAALLLVPGPKVASLGRAARLPAHGAPDAPGHRTPEEPGCVGAACNVPDQCFAAGTLVHAARGLVAIETVKKGDFVWSREEGSGALGLRRVARTFVNADKPILELALRAAHGESDALKVTHEHPFWTRERGWVSAKDLRIGEEVLQRVGGYSRITASTSAQERADVFNFEVEDFHTYFVGAAGVWVHNECKEPLTASRRVSIERQLEAAEYYAARTDVAEAERRAAAAGAERLRARLDADDALRGVPPRSQRPAGGDTPPPNTTRTPPRQTFDNLLSLHFTNGTLPLSEFARVRSSLAGIREAFVQSGLAARIERAGIRVEVNVDFKRVGSPGARYYEPNKFNQILIDGPVLEIDGGSYGLINGDLSPFMLRRLLSDVEHALDNPY